MFRSHAIILSLQKIRDNQIRIILFTQEYGKISCWSKKPILSDIGNIALVLLERKGTENHLKSIETLISIENSLENFDTILEMLNFLEMLYRTMPESLELKGIYTDIANTWNIIKEKGLPPGEDRIVQMLVLIQIRILKKLGFLRKEYFEQNPTLSYIYTNIDTKTPLEIAQGKGLSHETLATLRENILKTRHYLTHGI